MFQLFYLLEALKTPNKLETMLYLVGFKFRKGKPLGKILEARSRFFRNTQFWMEKKNRAQWNAYKKTVASLNNLPQLAEKCVKYEKSTLRDAFSNVFSGISMSRLYMGSKVIHSFKTPSGDQMFGFTKKSPLPELAHRRDNRVRYVHGSLAHILHSVMGSFNISISSSFACHEMIRLSRATVAHGTKGIPSSKGMKCFNWLNDHVSRQQQLHEGAVKDWYDKHK
jgi:hypothetical protein